MDSQHCAQRINALTRDYVMTNKRVESEARNHQRFRAGEGVFVILKPSHSHVGRLIDISMGGLAFDYVVDGVLPKPPAELEIFVKGGAFRMNGIPCKAIWAKTTEEGRVSTLKKRRCGVQFGELTDQQKAKLKEFIETYTTGEA
jgi:hypothetical protein